MYIHQWFFFYILHIYFSLFYFIVELHFPHFPPLFSHILPTPPPTFNPPPTLLSLSMGLLSKFLDNCSPFFPVIALPSAYSQFVLYFHVSGSMLLTCLFCWLGSTYRWDHMVFVLHLLLISLSIILFSSIHAVVKGRSSFFLLCSIPLCKYTTVFWSTHLLGEIQLRDGNLGGFQHLAIINCAAMNTGVHRFFWIGV